ncbi:MAG: ATP-binding protein [Rikenellaceae bacterium]
MKTNISHLKMNIWKIVITIFSFFLFLDPCFANNLDPKNEIGSDYVLIINSYSESSDWSNSFIRPIYESLFSNKSDLTAYTEHMNMLIIQNDADLEEYKTNLFDKYTISDPKVVVLLGNTPWGLLRNEIEQKWPSTHVILCVEEDYIGPREAYLEKIAIPKEQRIPLKEYKGPVDLTVIYIPIYLNETVSMMKRMIPGMNKLIFLSDTRYVCAQNRQDLKELLEASYPNVKLQNLEARKMSTNNLVDSLYDADPKTGILYLSWHKRNTFAGNVVVTTNDYKIFSRYTDLPIFTLSDNEIATVGMLGGYFFSTKHVNDIMTKTFHDVISGKNNGKLTIVDCGKPTYVFNHKILTKKGISDKLCPKDTLFYMQDKTFWEEYKYWIVLAVGVIISAFIFLVMKMKMLNTVKKEQERQIFLMNNYSSLFNNMPIAYSKQKLIYDDNGNIIDYVVDEINPYFKKYFALENSPIQDHGTTMNNNSTFKDYINLYELALKDKKSITVQQYNKDTGKYFSMIIVPSKVNGYMDIFCVDNTELSTTQQILRTLNNKLSMALDVANIIPWKWDLEKGTILCDINHKNDINLDLSVILDDQITVPYNIYFSKICKRDIERVKQAYNDLLAGKVNKIKEEYRVFVNHDNKKGYEWVEAQAIVDKRDDSGRPISLIGSSLVISDRKKLEADLVNAKDRAEESNRLKSAFLANMSHEIRTPLNAIIGFSEVLATTDDLEEKHEYVSIIENNNTLLLQLISDILDLSKIEAGMLEFVYSNVRLNDIFLEFETTFKMRVGDDNSKVQVVYESEFPECYIRTDQNRLSQVVINILNNAIKFTDEGSIHFGYRLVDDNTLYFYVKDTGCGIPKDKIDGIFGRFVKLNNFAQGTGLGLSICQTIIHNMGGEIGVESTEGEGAKFWFTIPYEPAINLIEEHEEIVQKIVERDKLSVLIAEDNASNFKLFETILKGEYKIYHAWDGEDAVKLFKEHKPHIILMDINMPKMNGYEATAKIREISKNVPIIAVTAYAYASDEQRIIDSGFSGYAAKPVNSTQLKSQMINLLKRQLIFI